MSEPQKNDAHDLEVVKLDLLTLPLSAVSLHPDNPRIHTEEQIEALMESLRYDGYIAGSMGIQLSRKRLYKGHGVYEALTRLGCIEADFVVKDLTDVETLALLARDNALSDMSTNDPVKLKVISVELQQMNVPIQRMGYTLKEITQMQPKPEVVEDESPEVSEEVVSKTGDLWHLGKHRVLNGDSTKKSDVERVMGGEKAVLMIADPPYGILYSEESTGRARITGNAGRPEPYSPIAGDGGDIYPAFLSAVISILAEDWAGFVFFSGNRSEFVYRAFRCANVRVGQICIWVKPSPNPSYRKYLFRHEPFLFVGPSSNVKPNGRWFGNSNATTVWEYGRESDIGKHPTMNPVAMIATMISDMTGSGENVFDPFLGSGTTLIAADQLERICYGIEIAPKYVDVIVKRYINHSLFDSAGVSVERKGKTLTWEQANKKLPKVV